MRKHWIVGGLMAASLLVGSTPALASRDDLGTGGMGWQWTGGTKTSAGVSVDGPKSSNAYNLAEGSYVYLRGYWDVPLAQYSAGFAYRNDGDVADGDGSPRISVILSNAGVETGEVIYLDPYWCPSAANAKGWATTSFFRIGADCTIFGSWSATGYTGTATTSAWSAVMAAAQGQESYYSFLIADSAGSTMVDRVRFGSAVLSLFGQDSYLP